MQINHSEDVDCVSVVGLSKLTSIFRFRPTLKLLSLRMTMGSSDTVVVIAEMPMI